MADNVAATSVSIAGATFATDDIGGVHYPRTKVAWGPDGTANETAVATPFPVQVVSIAADVSSVVSVKNFPTSVDSSVKNVDASGNVLVTFANTQNVSIAAAVTINSAITTITGTGVVKVSIQDARIKVSIPTTAVVCIGNTNAINVSVPLTVNAAITTITAGATVNTALTTLTAAGVLKVSIQDTTVGVALTTITAAATINSAITTITGTGVVKVSIQDARIKVSIATTAVVCIGNTNAINVSVPLTVRSAITTITAGANMNVAVANSPENIYTVTINPGPYAQAATEILVADHQGKLLTSHYAAGEVFSSITLKVSASAAVTIFTSAGASVQLWITELMVINAGGTGTWVHFIDTDTTIWSGYAASGGGGFVNAFPAPGLPVSLGGSLRVKSEASAVEYIAGIVGHKAQR